MGVEAIAQPSLGSISSEASQQAEMSGPMGTAIPVRFERNAKQAVATGDSQAAESVDYRADLAHSALPRASQSQAPEQPASEDARPLEKNNGNQGPQLAAKGRGTKKDVSVDDLLELLKRQNFRCALSGRALTPNDCTIDHIEPFSFGVANHAIRNLQLVVQEANKAKGVLSMAAFIRLCCDVADYQRGQGRLSPAGRKDTPSD